jgi:hypothetical protein
MFKFENAVRITQASGNNFLHPGFCKEENREFFFKCSRTLNAYIENVHVLE